jgi:hypothetical protein
MGEEFLPQQAMMHGSIGVREGYAIHVKMWCFYVIRRVEGNIPGAMEHSMAFSYNQRHLSCGRKKTIMKPKALWTLNFEPTPEVLEKFRITRRAFPQVDSLEAFCEAVDALVDAAKYEMASAVFVEPSAMMTAAIAGSCWEAGYDASDSQELKVYMRVGNKFVYAGVIRHQMYTEWSMINGVASESKPKYSIKYL